MQAARGFFAALRMTGLVVCIRVTPCNPWSKRLAVFLQKASVSSMPAKKDPRVDAYIAKAAPFAQPIPKHLRKAVHAACPEVTEDIKWSMPSFIYNGKILCGMAAFKAHATFGFWHRGMEDLLKKELG